MSKKIEPFEDGELRRIARFVTSPVPPHPASWAMDKPEPGKVYALTGGPDTPALSNGNTWAESEVRQAESEPEPTDDPIETHPDAGEPEPVEHEHEPEPKAGA